MKLRLLAIVAVLASLDLRAELTLSLSQGDPAMLSTLYGRHAGKEIRKQMAPWTCIVRNTGAGPALIDEATAMEAMIGQARLRVVPQAMAQRVIQNSYKRSGWSAAPRVLEFAAKIATPLLAFDIISAPKLAVGIAAGAAELFRWLAGYIHGAAPDTTDPLPLWPETVLLEKGHSRVVAMWTVPYSKGEYTYRLTVAGDRLPHADAMAVVGQVMRQGLTMDEAADNLLAMTGEGP